MRLDRHGDLEVARGTAVDAGLAVALDADLLAVLDTRGDADLDRRAADLDGQGRAVQGLTEGNGQLCTHGPALLRGGRRLLGVTGGAEGRTVGVAPKARARTAATAEEAGEDVLEASPAAGHAGGLEAHVVTAASEAAGAAEGTEEVLEAARAARSGGEACPAASHRADRVIALTILVIGQDGVGLADFLELGLSGLVARVLIRVPLPSQLAVGLGDGLLVRCLVDSEDLVEVLGEPFLFTHARVTSLSVASVSMSFRVVHQYLRGAHNAFATAVAAREDLPDDGMVDVRAGGRHEGVVQGGIEVVARSAIALELETRLERLLELRGDRREGAVLQVAVRAGGGDVVEDADERLDDLILARGLVAGDGLLGAAHIVGVLLALVVQLRVGAGQLILNARDALEGLGEVRVLDLLLEGAHVVGRTLGRGLGSVIRAGCGLVILGRLAGRGRLEGVGPGDVGVFVGRRETVGFFGAHLLSSSTISASTTSSCAGADWAPASSACCLA